MLVIFFSINIKKNINKLLRQNNIGINDKKIIMTHVNWKIVFSLLDLLNFCIKISLI